MKAWIIAVVVTVLLAIVVVGGYFLWGVAFLEAAVVVMKVLKFGALLMLIIFCLYGTILAITCMGIVGLVPRFIDERRRADFIEKRPALIMRLVTLLVPNIIAGLFGLWMLSQPL